MDMLVPCWFLEPNGALRNWRMEVGLISRCWFWNKNAKTLRRLAYPDWCMGTHCSWSLFRVVSPILLGLTIFIFHGHKRGPKVVYEEGVLKSLIGIMILYQAGTLSFDVCYLTFEYVGVVFLNGWVVYCFLLDSFWSCFLFSQDGSAKRCVCMWVFICSNNCVSPLGVSLFSVDINQTFLLFLVCMPLYIVRWSTPHPATVANEGL